MDQLTATATKDPEGFLGHPVNAFKLMKRLNTEWGELESLVLKDMSDGECVCLQQKPASRAHCRYLAVAFHMSGLELDLQICF